MEANERFKDGRDDPSKEGLWYVDNYVLLKDYFDRTISRVAARCVRKGNIAVEEYEHYGYILDVLDEICETGDHIINHPELYPYVEKKIAGGLNNLRKTLNEFKQELKNNASPEMIKQDKDELEKMKEALGTIDKSKDPTVGAGMSMDEVVGKLLQNQQTQTAAPQPQRPAPQQQPQQPQPAQQAQQAQAAPRPQQQAPQQQSPQPKPQNPSPEAQVQQSPFNNGAQ